MDSLREAGGTRTGGTRADGHDAVHFGGIEGEGERCGTGTLRESTNVLPRRSTDGNANHHAIEPVTYQSGKCWRGFHAIHTDNADNNSYERDGTRVRPTRSADSLTDSDCAIQCTDTQSKFWNGARVGTEWSAWRCASDHTGQNAMDSCTADGERRWWIFIRSSDGWIQSNHTDDTNDTDHTNDSDRADRKPALGPSKGLPIVWHTTIFSAVSCIRRAGFAAS